jgi:hypothetical protein
MLALGSALSSSAATLFTTNAAGNSGGNGWTVLMDMNVLAGGGITITSLGLSMEGASGPNFSVEVYTTPITFVGSQTNAAAWTLVATGAGVQAGNATTVDISDFSLAAGSYGFAIRTLNASGDSNQASPTYTDGNGSNQSYSNADLSLSMGSSVGTPGSPLSGAFAGSVFDPRVFNGSINYDLTGAETPEPSTFGMLGLSLTALAFLRRRK